MRTFLLATAFSLLLSQSTQAAVIERDLFSAGDGRLTFDDINNREWLDLTYTSGVNVASVLDAMNDGQFLEGFKFATVQDVSGLADSAGVVWLTDETATFSQEAHDNALALHYLLGEVFFFEVRFRNVATGLDSVVAYRSSFGLVVYDPLVPQPNFDGTNVFLSVIDPPSSGTIRLVGSRKPTAGFTTTPQEGFPLATGDTGPFWLYREVVPEPSTYALIIVAAITVATTKLGRRGF